MVRIGIRVANQPGGRVAPSLNHTVARGPWAVMVAALGVIPLFVPTLAAQREPASTASASHAHARDRDAIGSDERPEILAKVLRTDPDASLRRKAAWGLAHFEHSSVGAEALSAALLHDASADVRETAAWALPESGATAAQAVDALTSALRSDNSASVRATSAWALGELRPGDTANSALQAAVRDSDRGVRQRAIWALGQTGIRTAPAVILDCLRDPDPEVRSLAAWALRSIGDHAAIPALKSAFLVESDPHLRIEDMHALNSMGDASLDAIRSILESPDKTIQAKGIDALANGRASGPWPWPWPDPRPSP